MITNCTPFQQYLQVFSNTRKPIIIIKNVGLKTVVNRKSIKGSSSIYASKIGNEESLSNLDHVQSCINLDLVKELLCKFGIV